MKQEAKTETVHTVQWLSHQPRPVRIAVAWLDRNFKTVVSIVAGALVIGAIWGGISWYQYHTQQTALKLYAELPVDPKGRDIGLTAIADEYPETGAGMLANFSLGRKSFEAGDYESAERHYKALQSLPERQAMIRIMAQHNLGVVLETQGKWQEAFEIYRKAAADPANQTVALTYYHMGRAAEALGKKDEARKWYEEAIDKGLGLAVANRAKERMLWLDIGKSS